MKIVYIEIICHAYQSIANLRYGGGDALSVSAKYLVNIMLGFGIGVGQSKLNMKHSQIINDPIQTPTAGSTALRWQPQPNRALSSWALAWEFLV